MPVKTKVFGPYRVRHISINGNVYHEVVEMKDNHSRDSWEELRPRYNTFSRQAAYGKCIRLNKRWQKDMEECLDDPFAKELLEYWKNATN